MQISRHSFTLLAGAAASALILSACGGGSSTPPALIQQTITFSAPSTATSGGTATLTATSSSGLTTFTFASSTTSVCTVSGSTVSFLSGGSACSLTASQAGDATYASATSAASTVTPLNRQTITFNAPATATVGDTATLSAASTSSLTTFTFASSTPSICTVAGSVVTFVSGGSACSLTASQAGNSSYASGTSAASTVTPPAVLAFSTGFGANDRTVEVGKFGGYSGSSLDNWSCGGGSPVCGGGADLVPTVTAANSRFYYYYSVPSAPNGQYTGIFVQAPGVTAISATADTAGVTATTQTKMNFTLGANPEFFANTNHNVAVLLTLGKFYSVGGNACNLKLLKVMPLTAASDTNYTVSLSSFSVTQDCGTGITTASAALAISAISQVDFQANGGDSVLTQGGLSTGANSTVVDQYGGRPTTLAVKGGISFK